MSLPLILVHDVDTFRENLGLDLSNCGFSVRACGSASGFLSALEAGPATVVVLVSTPPRVTALTGQLRRLAQGSLLVALFDDTDPTLRVRVLQAGADACHPVDLTAPELAVALLGWALRQGRGGSAPLASAGEVSGAARSGSGVAAVAAADRQVPLPATLAGLAHDQPRGQMHGQSCNQPHGSGHDAAHRHHQRCPPLHQRLHSPPHAHARQSMHSLQRLQQRAQRQMRPPDPLKELQRLPPMDEPPAGGREPAWCLQEHGRVLVGPLGQSLSLTASESLFLSRLMASNGRLVRRDAGGAEAGGQSGVAHDAATSGAATARGGVTGAAMARLAVPGEAAQGSDDAGNRSRGSDNLLSGNLTSVNLTSGNLGSGNLGSGDLGSGDLDSGNLDSGNLGKDARGPDVRGDGAGATGPNYHGTGSDVQAHGVGAFRASSACATEGSARPGPSRSLDVLVSRLRRKAQKRGVDLPLLAVRGWGYLFLDRLDRAPD